MKLVQLALMGLILLGIIIIMLSGIKLVKLLMEYCFFSSPLNS